MPSAVVHHRAAAATSQLWAGARTERWLRSTYASMLRRRGPAATRAYGLINTLGALARLLALTPAALALGGHRRTRWREMASWTRLHGANLLAGHDELETHR